MKSIKASVVVTSKDLFPEPINLIKRTPMLVSESRSTSQRHEIEPASSELLFDSTQMTGKNGVLYFYAEADKANPAGVDIIIINKSTGSRSTFMKLLPGEAGYLPAYANDQKGVSIVAKNLDLIKPAAVKYTYWSRDMVDQIAEKKPLTHFPTTSTTTTTVPPLDFDLSFSCTYSPDTVSILALNARGGTGGYQFGIQLFQTEAAALANSIWVPADSFSYSRAGINLDGEFWVVLKDSANSIIAKNVVTDCAANAPTTTTTTTAAPDLTVTIGPGTYFDLPATDGTGTGTFTIEWWAKITRDDNHPRPWSIGSYNTAAHAVSIENGMFYWWVNGVIRFTVNISGYDYLNQWTHFAVVRTRDGDVTVHINGDKPDVGSFTGPIPSEGKLLYLGSEGNDSIMHGLMSNFRWTNADVYDVYSNGTFTPPTAPLSALTDNKILIFQGTSLNDELSGIIAPGTGIDYYSGSYNSDSPFGGTEGCIQFGQIPTITLWQTLNPNETIYLPFVTGVVSTIDWGDGSQETWNSGLYCPGHTYSTPGTYEVRSYTVNPIDELPISFILAGANSTYTPSQLHEILQWGSAYPTMDQAFHGCLNLNLPSVRDVPYLGGVHALFEGCSSLSSIKHINDWNVAGFANFSRMFRQTQFNQDISGWNVAAATDMSWMFSGSSFNQDISGWNVANVTNMAGMFEGCSYFNQPLDGWNVSNVTDMAAMFHSAVNFNQDISSWNVSNVTNMATMFYLAFNFNQDISSWNVSNVTDMSGMFLETEVFNQSLANWERVSSPDTSTLANCQSMSGMFAFSRFDQPIGNWNVSGVADMSAMFYSNHFFNQPIGNWNVSSVQTMYQMFGSATAFNQPLANWERVSSPDTSTLANVADLSFMFDLAVSFNQPIGNWNLSSAVDMSSMFNGANQFNQPLAGWNVGTVELMDSTFQNASAFNQDLSGWCVSLIEAEPVFFRTGATAWTLPQPVWGTCPPPTTTTTTSAPTTTTTTTSAPTTTTTTVASLPFISVWRTTSPNETITLPYEYADSRSSGTIDWGDGTTSNNLWSLGNNSHTYSAPGDYTITITGSMDRWRFASYPASKDKIIEILQWGCFYMGSNIDGQFFQCSNLTLTNVSDVPNLTGVTSLNSTFTACTSLTTINNINNWYMFNVTNIAGMFSYTPFNQSLSGWNVQNVTNMYGTFRECTSFNNDIFDWNVTSVQNMDYMFAGCTSFNRDISIWNVSSVTSMTGMFAGCTSFNRDLSSWCVGNISSIPQYFDDGTTSWTLPKPSWGTCPVRNGLSALSPGLSAWQIKRDYPESADGLYWIKNYNINGGTPFQIYADMTTRGGGWTLIMTNQSHVGWTYANSILLNESSPVISGANYSIIAYADYLKRDKPIIQYMIEANSRNSYGGIWQAPYSYSFVNTDNTQTNIVLDTKFGTWTYSENFGISQRMPWHSNNYGLITTSSTGTDSWWGTLITNYAVWDVAPWMSSGCGVEGCMQNPAAIWYWVR